MQTLHTPEQAAQWLHQRVQGQLQVDSRKVRAGDGFIAWPGGVSDGRQFVADALRLGARACLVEEDGAQAFDWDAAHPALGAYSGLKKASGPIAAAYYEHPSTQLDVLAVTGTNGKTSTAWWLAQALGQLGRRCAVVGTLGVGELHQLTYTGLTTPDPVLLQAQLRRMVDAGVQACAMEASSIGLAEHRMDGTRVRVGLFTNFTQDHLDYHGDMQTYWQAKAVLFDWPGLQAAVVNIDDAHGAALAQQLHARAAAPDVWTVGLSPAARLHARHIVHGHGAGAGLTFEVVESDQAVAVQTTLVGLYNVHNVLGVVAGLRALGHTLDDAVRACAQLTPVPGRMQRLSDAGKPEVVVDYAHTPDALEQVLRALQPLARSRQGRLICVVGCGGDRDPGKRAPMARVAELAADQLVLTSDNPRSEDPLTIVQDMQAGLQQPQRVTVQLDRAKAIAQTVLGAGAHDVVLVAGKGHEDYQEIAGVRHPFADVDHARAALQAWRLA